MGMTENEKEVCRRFDACVRFLKEKGVIKNFSEFANEIGIKRSDLYGMMRSSKPVTSAVVRATVDYQISKGVPRDEIVYDKWFSGGTNFIDERERRIRESNIRISKIACDYDKVRKELATANKRIAAYEKIEKRREGGAGKIVLTLYGDVIGTIDVLRIAKLLDNQLRQLHQEEEVDKNVLHNPGETGTD